MTELSPRSRKNLEGVHPVLVRVVHRVAEIAPPFVITEGRRTKERQAELVRRKKSKTMNSRHITGHAVDFVAWVDGEPSWSEQHMRPIADAFATAAGGMGVKIERGIDWGWDSPHIELDRKAYPADGPEESISRPLEVAAPAAQVAKPLAKSRTLWSIFAGGSFLTWLGDLVNQGLDIVTHAGTQFAAIGPGREVLAMIGGNGSTIAWAIGIGCLVSAACARIDDSNKAPPKPEGEPS